jgi:hypothetical protein
LDELVGSAANLVDDGVQRGGHVLRRMAVDVRRQSPCIELAA